MTDELLPLHWIKGYHEGDLDFCFECAQKKLAELQNKNPNKHYFLDGGWATECDCPPTCETCGRDLDYIPTDYCLEVYPESEAML